MTDAIWTDYADRNPAEAYDAQAKARSWGRLVALFAEAFGGERRHG